MSTVTDDLAAAAPPEPAAPQQESRVRGLLGRSFRAGWPVVAALGSVLLAWQIVVWAKVLPDYRLPTPHEVWSSLRDFSAHQGLLGAIGTSLRRGIEGYALVIAVSTVLGLLISAVPPVRAALRALLSGLQTAPSVCWVPPVVLMFGVTEKAIFIIMLLSAVPAVTNGLVAGLDQVPPVIRRAGRVLGARGFTHARIVMLPAALPAYLAGIRTGWAFAWHALMTAEVISFSPQLGIGVGHLLDNARQLPDIAGTFAAVIVIIALGVLAEQCVFAPLERGVLRRRGLLSH